MKFKKSYQTRHLNLSSTFKFNFSSIWMSKREKRTRYASRELPNPASVKSSPIIPTQIPLSLSILCRFQRACVKTILNIIALCRTPTESVVIAGEVWHPARPISPPSKWWSAPLVVPSTSDERNFGCEKFSCGDPAINCDWISHHFVTLLAMTAESVVTEG